MKNKICSLEKFQSLLKDGMRIMVGGFAGCGVPEILIGAIVASKVKDLTIISNDSTHPGEGVAELIAAGQVKKLIASHIGMNPQTAEKMFAKELAVELVPQGSLAERIRAKGAGLGGVLTQTGLGTEVESGKEIIEIEGKSWLLELPLGADLAIIRGSLVDLAGNVVYYGTTSNFNQVMATAADLVVAAAETIVEVGQIEPKDVMTPGIFVDYIVGGEPHER